MTGILEHLEDRWRFIERFRLVVHASHRGPSVSEGPVRQSLVGRRAKPAVAYRIIARELADNADLVRTVAFHQLICVLRMAGVRRYVVQQKTHHLRLRPTRRAE